MLIQKNILYTDHMYKPISTPRFSENIAVQQTQQVSELNLAQNLQIW